MNVRFEGHNGHDADVTRCPLFPMSLIGWRATSARLHTDCRARKTDAPDEFPALSRCACCFRLSPSAALPCRAKVIPQRIDQHRRIVCRSAWLGRGAQGHAQCHTCSLSSESAASSQYPGEVPTRAKARPRRHQLLAGDVHHKRRAIGEVDVAVATSKKQSLIAPCLTSESVAGGIAGRIAFHLDDATT
jgi:hypothetical protein